MKNTLKQKLRNNEAVVGTIEQALTLLRRHL